MQKEPAGTIQVKTNPEERRKIDAKAQKDMPGETTATWAKQALLELAERSELSAPPKRHERWHKLLQDILDATSSRHADLITGNLEAFHELVVRPQAVPAPSRKRA